MILVHLGNVHLKRFLENDTGNGSRDEGLPWGSSGQDSEFSAHGTLSLTAGQELDSHKLQPRARVLHQNK